jgi:hypothetical protein
MEMDIAYCVRDTYAPARFGELPLLSVPCKLTVSRAAHASLRRWNRWFGKLEIYIDFRPGLSPDQTAQ